MQIYIFVKPNLILYIRCGSTQIEHYYDFCHSCIACPQKQAKTIKYYITRSQIVTILLGKIVKTSNNNVPLLIINFTIIFFRLGNRTVTNLLSGGFLDCDV